MGRKSLQWRCSCLNYLNLVLYFVTVKLFALLLVILFVNSQSHRHFTYFLKNSMSNGFGCSIMAYPWTCDEDISTNCLFTILDRIFAEQMRELNTIKNQKMCMKNFMSMIMTLCIVIACTCKYNSDYFVSILWHPTHASHCIALTKFNQWLLSNFFYLNNKNIGIQMKLLSSFFTYKSFNLEIFVAFLFSYSALR